MAGSGLQPGGNPTGITSAVPTVGGGGPTPAIGGSSNPFNPSYPTGSANPTASDPLLAALSQMNPAGSSVVGPGNQGNINGLTTNSIVSALRKQGISSGDAYLLATFLEGGAGFNPHAVEAVLKSLGPQIKQGEADIMSQFGAEGLGSGSNAAYGLGNFLSSVTLNEGQIISQMYEQSVQDYLQVLLGPVSHPRAGTSGIGSMLGGAGGLAQGLGGSGGLLSSLGIGGGAAAGAAAGGAAAGGTDTALMLASFAAMCWVAMELWGAGDIRTTLVRGYLLVIGESHWYGRIFNRLYRRFGERVAAVIKRNRVARFFARHLFETILGYAVRRSVLNAA